MAFIIDRRFGYAVLVMPAFLSYLIVPLPLIDLFSLCTMESRLLFMCSTCTYLDAGEAGYTYNNAVEY